MRNGVDESIVLLIAAYFPNQKRRVEDESGNNQQEKNDSQYQQRDLARVEQDPADIQRNGQRHQGSTQRNEESYRFAPTTNCHGPIVAERSVAGRGRWGLAVVSGRCQ